ncbi:MAG: TatD family hydrolase, partial [Solobacterium sp.]|nr:TatD family hydrolase [Solobacterium sp.]
MKYIDICVNLFSERLPDPDEVIRKAAAEEILCIADGCDMASNARLDAYLRTHEGIYGTVGIHPHDAKDMQEGDTERLAELMRTNERIIAFGECGLDYDRMYSPRDVQLACFNAQVELAERYEKPLVIHEREAVSDTLRILEDHRAQAGRSVIHCFTGNADTVKQYVDLGLYIGITGWVC